MEWKLLKTANKEYWYRTEGDSNNIYQHREVMEKVIGRKLSKDENVDHIDGNGLNNDPSNLRICTHLENMRNRVKKSTPSTSEYKGVTFNKRKSKWQAKTTVNYKTIHLGYYNNEVEAALAYDKFTKENFGKFANPNFKDF
jgi:hypothetical protein